MREFFALTYGNAFSEITNTGYEGNTTTVNQSSSVKTKINRIDQFESDDNEGFFIGFKLYNENESTDKIGNYAVILKLNNYKLSKKGKWVNDFTYSFANATIYYWDSKNEVIEDQLEKIKIELLHSTHIYSRIHIKIKSKVILYLFKIKLGWE